MVAARRFECTQGYDVEIGVEIGRHPKFLNLSRYKYGGLGP